MHHEGINGNEDKTRQHRQQSVCGVELCGAAMSAASPVEQTHPSHLLKHDIFLS